MISPGQTKQRSRSSFIQTLLSAAGIRAFAQDYRISPDLHHKNRESRAFTAGQDFPGFLYKPGSPCPEDH